MKKVKSSSYYIMSIMQEVLVALDFLTPRRSECDSILYWLGLTFIFEVFIAFLNQHGNFGVVSSCFSTSFILTISTLNPM
jgi:hypothetical protein